MNFRKSNSTRSAAKYRRSKNDFQYLMTVSGELTHGKEIRSKTFGNFVYNCAALPGNGGAPFDPELDVTTWELWQ